MEKIRTNNLNVAQSKELQTFNAASVKPMNTQYGSNHTEQIGWKDLQHEMRSSGVVTNMAALEVVKKKMSTKCEDQSRSNDLGESNGSLSLPNNEVHVQDRINLKYPDKIKSLTWHQKKNFIKKLSNVGEEIFKPNQEKIPRSNSLSGDDIYEMLNVAVAADCPDAINASSTKSSSWSSFSSFMKSFSDLKGEVIPSKQEKSRSSSMSDDEFFSMISEAVHRDELDDSFESLTSLNNSEHSLSFETSMQDNVLLPQKGLMLETFPEKPRRRTHTARTA